jgi:hypothetical protein
MEVSPDWFRRGVRPRCAPTARGSGPAGLTANNDDDGAQVGPLFDQVTRPVVSFIGDGALDRDDVYEVAERHVTQRSSCRRVRVMC